MNKTKIYHQTGHNFIWNVDSFKKDKVGDGLIFSPRDIEYEKITVFDNKIKKVSFFDPQFYLPSSEREKLNTYDFFPNKTMSQGYNTVSFGEKCSMIAEKCINFQISNDFKYLVIPSLYFETNNDDTLNKNETLIIKPFMNKIKYLNVKNKPVLLNIFVDENTIKDDILRENLITYITSFQNIDGVYLIPICKRAGKRIDDNNFILYLLEFIFYLKYNNLEVHVGYNDIEGLLLTIADVDSISIGGFENVRNFSIERFENTNKRKSQPRPRVFSPALLQWIDSGYFGIIRKQFGDLSNFFGDSIYANKLFGLNSKVHLPDVYKHFFIVFSDLIYSLPTDYMARYNYIINHIKSAEVLYDKLEKIISFDTNSNCSHLNKWETAINEYNIFVKS